MSAPRRPPRAESGPVAAVLEPRGRFLVATPLFERGRRLTVDAKGRARAGDLVLVQPPRPGGQGRQRGRATVVRRLGRPDVARDVIDALLADRGLRRDFPDDVQRAAEAAAAAPAPADRRDLRALPTFTIDPATAKDFDDAISAEALGEGRWRIHVHIADVSAHVRPGSPLDREARRRGTSVYVPGTVAPMLPEALSNRACSLVPGEDRLAVTVEMELHGADVQRAAFHRSTIRSDVRLDYDEVDRIFAGAQPTLDPWGEPLGAARAAAAALADLRARAGALAIESTEPEFAFDRQGHVVDAARAVQTESHRLIEHLMIAANEQVAELLSARKVPALYRVHERPEPAAVQRLADQLASLGVPTPPIPEHLSPQQAGDLVGEISQQVAAHVAATGRGGRALTSLVLRSLKQAHYAARNLGHAGLRSSAYCHFTSPIRRYPDLVCHRALLSAVGGGEDAPRAERMDGEGAWASEREREAMEAERDADDIARCFLLAQALYDGGHEQDFDGEVVGLIGAGAFVAFGDGYEGLLPVRRLRGDWWELNELGTILEGTKTGKAIRLGDPVRVQVDRVDAPRGRVDLLPVEV